MNGFNCLEEEIKIFPEKFLTFHFYICFLHSLEKIRCEAFNGICTFSYIPFQDSEGCFGNLWIGCSFENYVHVLNRQQVFENEWNEGVEGILKWKKYIYKKKMERKCDFIVHMFTSVWVVFCTKAPLIIVPFKLEMSLKYSNLPSRSSVQ